MEIEIRLPRSRWAPGTLTLRGATVQLVCPCLGRADTAAAIQAANPTRDMTRRNGDTPTGRYLAKLDGVKAPPRSYGPHPVIRLYPKAGAAAEAAANGRDGLLIHGGAPAADGVSLRPTFGCIRVADYDQERLVAAIQWEGNHLFTVTVEEF